MMKAAPGPSLWTGPIDYALPPELVAQHPAPRRNEARLMVVDRTRRVLDHKSVADLPAFLGTGDVVVANDSGVIPARLHARKESGGAVELLLLRSEASRAVALARSSKPMHAGQRLRLQDGSEAVVETVHEDGRCSVDFGCRAALAVAGALGKVPLPPYIRGGEEGPGDRERYQTVYARVPGSVAAPTAGLHFTAEMLAELEARGARFRTLTLHVGPGTFTPIRDGAERHVMDAEHVRVEADLVAEVDAIRRRHGRVVAVGTTSVRALESAADPARPGHLQPFQGDTRLFIRPGHPFLVCDALLTNFHLPRSTLLCLVMAFAGTELVRYAYEEAIRLRYRFYSYGDAMLIV
jgi:S-adenosylmethionine:tRNA ribosyltransferase-isomerase